MRWECRGRFLRHRLQRKPLVSDPDMQHSMCVTRWWEKRSRLSRRMCNPQFYVSGKRSLGLFKGLQQIVRGKSAVFPWGWWVLISTCKDFPFFHKASKIVTEFHFTLYNGCNYLTVMGLKLNHISKRDP